MSLRSLPLCVCCVGGGEGGQTGSQSLALLRLQSPGAGGAAVRGECCAVCAGPGDLPLLPGGAVAASVPAQGPGRTSCPHCSQGQWPTLHSLTNPLPPPPRRGSVCGQWLCSLQELYIAFNEVRDVSVAAMLPCLQLLDMERCVFM